MGSINIPPVAKGVICVDFDGTIFEWGDLSATTPPFEGAIEAIQEFKRLGWEIVILTSRMSPTWWAAEGMVFKDAMMEQMSFVKKRLEAYDIPYDRITAEKVPAEYYIDDKAVEFDGKFWSWGVVRYKVTGGHRE